jgi:hypothetical protein
LIFSRREKYSVGLLDLMPCGLAGRYLNFEKYSASISSLKFVSQYMPPNCWFLPTNLHLITAQETKAANKEYEV